MNNDTVVRVLSHLKRNNVPLTHSLQLICKSKGIALGRLATKSGYHRNYLYKCLCGEIIPADDFKKRISAEVGVDPWLYGYPTGGGFKIDTASIRRLFSFLKDEEIPLQYSVSMVCKARGIALGKLASDCGYHRNQLYLSLTGVHRPSKKLRKGVEKQLGVDPWDYAPVQETCA